MATQQDVFNELQNIKTKIIEKGGTITQANINVSLPELTAGVASIPTGGASYVIKAAELPNTTLTVYDSENTQIDSKSTGENGGVVELNITESGTYTVKATKDGTEIWTNSITVDEIGVYNCKSGKSLNEYTWAEIQSAGNGGYAEFMWSKGDYKDLASFMGQTSSSYTRAIILGFNHDDKADGTGKASITFKLPYTSSTYAHRSASGSNGVSWVGSLIRQNALKAGESYYLYDDTITSSTTGTYYKYNTDTDDFVEVTLPDEYVTNTKYYTKTTLSADGAFIAGLPEEITPYIKQVTKKTWTGYIGTSSSSDATVIKTKDWLFLLSDSEVFGDSNRYVNYSKYTAEGNQYDYFKEYAENKLRFGYYQWLRSPNVNYGSYFCYWSNNGYVSNSSANNTYRVALCFCI